MRLALSGARPPEGPSAALVSYRVPSTDLSDKTARRQVQRLLPPPTPSPNPRKSRLEQNWTAFRERRKQQLVATSIAMVEEVGGPREPLGGEGQEAMAVGIAATFREDAIALNVPRHTTVYVGRIPKTYDEERVDLLLGACGRVRSFLRATHPETNAAKHYGFCEYRDGLSCMRAIEVLDGLQGKSPLSLSLSLSWPITSPPSAARRASPGTGTCRR